MQLSHLKLMMMISAMIAMQFQRKRLLLTYGNTDSDLPCRLKMKTNLLIFQGV